MLYYIIICISFTLLIQKILQSDPIYIVINDFFNPFHTESVVHMSAL